MARGRSASVTIQNYIPDLLSQLPEEIESRMLTVALLVEGEVKEILTGQRTGRWYTVPATKKEWQASAPFEAPAVRLGELRRKYRGFTIGEGIYTEGIVASPTIYSKWLEFGTRKMAARPHLRRAAYNVLSQIEGEFEGFFE